MDGDSVLLGLRTMLVVAHPGHECRVLGWLKSLRPGVAALTDGSGHRRVSRVHRSAQLVDAWSGHCTSFFGVISDRSLYEAVLAVDVEYFQRLTVRLAQTMIAQRVELVIGDAAEGIIMAHDLFRFMRIAAVEITAQQLGRSVLHYEYPIDGHPGSTPAAVAGSLETLRLSPVEFARKIDAVRGYLEIHEFVAQSLEEFGSSAFACETIFPWTEQSLLPASRLRPLEYELHGRREYLAGRFAEVITERDHIWPLAEAILAMSPVHRTSLSSHAVCLRP